MPPSHGAARPPSPPRSPWRAIGIAGAIISLAGIVGAISAIQVARSGPKKGPGSGNIMGGGAGGAGTTGVGAHDLSARPVQSLTMQGSGTVGVEAAPLLVEGFFKKRGATDIRREKGARADDLRIVATTDKGVEAILIRSEGTAGGFQCLGEHTCDIAMAAREVHDAEAATLIEKGIGDLRLPGNEHVIALDGIAVIVNRGNPVRGLDRTQLDAVFSGGVTDWSGVGGTAGPIALVAHEPGAGTLDAFDAMVLGGHPLAPSARRMPDNAAIADAVTVDVNAIGFVGLAFVRSTKALAVSDRGVPPMFPTPFTVTTEKYLLSRRFYLYTPAPPKPFALDFVDFVMSEPGQHAIRDAGLVDLEVSLKNAEPCDHCPARYASATKHLRRLSLDFRFRGNTHQLDARAIRDVDRVVRFLREHSSAKIVLFGFCDRTAEKAADVKRSRELAQAVNSELGARGVKAGTVEGFGAEMAVATNNTDWGRAKNRRVEIWVEEDK
jgi:phosphate transport system substrate-binding protein